MYSTHQAHEMKTITSCNITHLRWCVFLDEEKNYIIIINLTQVSYFSVRRSTKNHKKEERINKQKNHRFTRKEMKKLFSLLNTFRRIVFGVAVKISALYIIIYLRLKRKRDDNHHQKAIK